MRARSAWLLQTHRLALRPGMTRKQFAEELADRGLPGDEWQLSRWESGEHPIRRTTVRTYAEALGLDPAVLCGAVDYLKVSPLSSRPKPRDAAAGPKDEAEADDCFDRIFSGSGRAQDWSTAVRVLTSHPNSYVPRPFWRDLTARLLNEVYRSVGAALPPRARALALLLDGHPSQESAVEAVRDFAATSRSQALTITAMSMIHARSDLANRTSLEWLRHPDSGAQWGAVNAVALKLALGHYGPGDLPAIEATCLGLLASPQGRPSGLAFLRGLGPDSQKRIAAEVRNGDLLLQELHTSGNPPRAWTALAREIAGGAAARLEIPGLSEDPQLESLVLESCFGTYYEGRYVATLSLQASPYREALADQIASTLTSAGAEVVEPLAWLSCFIMGPRNHESLSRAAAAAPSGLARNLLLIALANLDDPPTATDVEGALAALRGSDPLPMRGASFLLGMQGLFAGLDLSGTPEWLPDLADWWSAQGGAIRV